MSSARERFMKMLADAIEAGSISKLTLGKPVDDAQAPSNLFVRQVKIKAGDRLSFVWRYATRDVTKNHEAKEALAILDSQIGPVFQDAHLFSGNVVAQLELGTGAGSLRTKTLKEAPAPAQSAAKSQRVNARAPWLRALGVTDSSGRPLSGMADKFRQIERFAELLGHRLEEIEFASGKTLQVFDMGCGKGYLTFATSEILGERAHVCGIERRADLVEQCSAVAKAEGIGGRLSFREGSIADTKIEAADVLIALHACDTATDDALAKGVAAGAALLVVSPCCQKEVRPQLRAAPVLESALGHGIFAERQAEFVTDALRAQLLEWAGYKTRVFEFISTEHTAKNTMITATRGPKPHNEDVAAGIRDFAKFYGVRHQTLATHLGFKL